VTTSEILSKYFVKSNSKPDESVCAAEGTLAFHTAVHHNSFKSMDCTSKLLREIFNDSEVAKRISSARTKTQAIVNSVLAPLAVQEVIKSLQDIPFCGVSTDASNHGAVKIFPMLIQYFNYENGGLQIKLLEVESKPN
jgi:oligoribonuclease (3'-5' exoribonuclease)